jgi:thioredoxin 1
MFVEELSGEYNGKVDFVKVNVDENGELAKKYNVFSIPTLAIFKNGEVVSQKVGASTKESFQTMIDSSLN